MRRLGVVLLLLAASCTGGDGDRADADARIPVCEPPMAAPVGFEPLPRFEEAYPDHVGVRLGHRDAGQREVHLSAGIPGEWGEGLPLGGTVALEGGGTASLFGKGRPAWLAIWDEGDICDPRVVLTNGLSQRELVDLLETAGIASRT